MHTAIVCSICWHLYLHVPATSGAAFWLLQLSYTGTDRQADTCPPPRVAWRQAGGWADMALLRISGGVRLELPGTKHWGSHRCKSFCLSASKWRRGMPSAAARQIRHFVFLHQYNLINEEIQKTHQPRWSWIVSTLRLQTDSSTGLFRCGLGFCVPQCFVCSEAELQSQMGVGWSPDDLPQRSGWLSVKGEKRKLGRGFWLLVVDANIFETVVENYKSKEWKKVWPRVSCHTDAFITAALQTPTVVGKHRTRSSRLQRVTAVILFELQAEQSNRASTNSWKGTPTDG